MTRLIDGERLERWLRDTQTTLIDSARERREADGEEDPTVLRMDGGIANLHIVLTSLWNFEYTAAGRRTPMDKISVPVKLKVRPHDPQTSWLAATDQSPERSQRLYRAIYLLLTKVGPMTDDELRQEMDRRGFNYHAAESVTKRRGELRDAGWVRATDLRRKSQDGGTMIVWEAVPEEA